MQICMNSTSTGCKTLRETSKSNQEFQWVNTEITLYWSNMEISSKVDSQQSHSNKTEEKDKETEIEMIADSSRGLLRTCLKAPNLTKCLNAFLQDPSLPFLIGLTKPFSLASHTLCHVGKVATTTIPTSAPLPTLS